MSESEKSREQSEEEEEQEQASENSQEKEEGDEDEEDGSEEEEEGDQEGDEDEDEDGDEEDEQGSGEDQDGEEGPGSEGEKQPNEQQEYKLPSFPKLDTDPYENRMSIDYINSEIASLQLSVNSFIGSLSSQGGTYPKLNHSPFSTTNQYPSHLPLSSAGFHATSTLTNKYRVEAPPPAPIHIKDFEIQVDMQPQIVIQNVSKLPPLQKKSSSYVINSEAQSYLSRLNEKGKGKEDVGRFQRRDEEIIDWEKRNREIDEAMRVMKQKY